MLHIESVQEVLSSSRAACHNRKFRNWNKWKSLGLWVFQKIWIFYKGGLSIQKHTETLWIVTSPCNLITSCFELRPLLQPKPNQKKKLLFHHIVDLDKLLKLTAKKLFLANSLQAPPRPLPLTPYFLSSCCNTQLNQSLWCHCSSLTRMLVWMYRRMRFYWYLRFNSASTAFHWPQHSFKDFQFGLCFNSGDVEQKREGLPPDPKNASSHPHVNFYISTCCTKKTEVHMELEHWRTKLCLVVEEQSDRVRRNRKVNLKICRISTKENENHKRQE